MLPGLNHNIPFQGKVYHVQTEDSGREHPHIITHVFIDGRIVASRKSDYGARLGEADLDSVVKTLMQEQHKDVIRDLIHARLPGFQAPAPAVRPAPVAPVAPAATRPAAAATRPATIRPAPSPSATRPAARQHAPAAPAATRPAAMQPAARVVPRTPAASAKPSPAAPVRPATPLPSAAPRVGAAPKAPAQPVEKPRTPGSAFGKDLVSDRSLDDVILQFISDEISKPGEGEGKK